MININTGFNLRSTIPLDSRDSFDTILAMTTFAESSIDEGHISYVKETDKYYKFNSTNTVDMTLGKWREYNGGGGSSTDEKVKLDATATDAKYLNELIDNATIEVDTTNNCLVVKKIDGQTATVAEINFLTGVTSNIQTQIDNLGKSMTMYGVFGTKADLLASTTPTPVDGNTAIIITDEDNDNKQMTYIYIESTSTWTQVAESSITVRDFTTNPIDLATETTGTLHKSKIDTAIARLADVLDKTTYRGTGDGIVKQADKLTGLTATIAALNQAVTDSHTHSNKTVLDKIVSNGIGSGFLADNGKYISILHIDATSPTYDSQIWIDNTDSSKPVLKIYDGTSWVSVSGSSSGSSTSITVDTTMSSTSTNPVQNKVIKAYADGKFATITTVDGKVDKTNILSAISSNPSNEKVLSEKAIKSELDLKANANEVLKTTDIKKTVDIKLTDNDICSGKAIYEAIEQKKDCIGKETVLHSGVISSEGTFSLTDDVNNYDFIIINHIHSADNRYRSVVLSKTEISKCTSGGNRFFCVNGLGSDASATAGYFNKNKVVISVYNGEKITSITGYKFGEVTIQHVIDKPSPDQSYSTSEQATGGTWIDGKPIYRKVYTGLSITANSSWTSLGISLPSGLDKIINARADNVTSSTYRNDGTISIGLVNGKLQYYTTSKYSINIPNVLILEYTKK